MGNNELFLRMIRSLLRRALLAAEGYELANRYSRDPGLANQYRKMGAEMLPIYIDEMISMLRLIEEVLVAQNQDGGGYVSH